MARRCPGFSFAVVRPTVDSLHRMRLRDQSRGVARRIVARMAGAVCLLALILLPGTGCRSADSCASHGAPCGGDPVGAWTMVSACRDPATSAPQQLTNLGQPVTVAREAPAPATSGDWCSGLEYGPGGVTAFIFPYDTLGVADGTLTVANDGTYEAMLHTRGGGSVNLAYGCMTRFGVGLTCAGLATGLAQVAAVKLTKPAALCTDSPSEPRACEFYKSYQDIQCGDDGAGGCNCSYGVSFAGSFGGTWTASGGQLTLADRTQTLPMITDFCVEAAAGVMTVWGHNAAPIFGEAGLQELAMRRNP